MNTKNILKKLVMFIFVLDEDEEVVLKEEVVDVEEVLVEVLVPTIWG